MAARFSVSRNGWSFTGDERGGPRAGRCVGVASKLEEVPTFWEPPEADSPAVSKRTARHVADQTPAQVGYEDLTALRLRSDPLRGVHGLAEDVTCFGDHLASMDADPHFHLATRVGQIVAVQLVLDRHRGGEGIASRAELGKEPVAERLDLPAVVSVELRPDDTLMDAPNVARHGLTAGSDKFGGAFDVGEHDRDGPGRAYDPTGDLADPSRPVTHQSQQYRHSIWRPP
jgi:hypothetical protein